MASDLLQVSDRVQHARYTSVKAYHELLPNVVLSCLIQCSSPNPDSQLIKHVVPLEQKHTALTWQVVTELPPASMMSNSLPGGTTLHLYRNGGQDKCSRAAALVSSRRENRCQLLSGTPLLSRTGVSLQHHGIRYRKISCQVTLQLAG